MDETPSEQFRRERESRLEAFLEDEQLARCSLNWMLLADRHKFTYAFEWLGRPVIRYPNDLLVLQEVICEVRPSVIIETGVAHGGSLVFSASILELLGRGRVIGIDVEIRPHNREAIMAHRLAHRIELIEGSSTDRLVIEEVRSRVSEEDLILVVLDSLHTHDHALAELRLFGPMVGLGSFIVVADTFIEKFPKGYYSDRPWDVGNNPMTAVRQFLAETDSFEIDRRWNKAGISEASDGYLRRCR